MTKTTQTTPIPLICKNCFTVFTPKVYRANIRFCSNKCRYSYWNHKNPVKRIKTTKTIRTSCNSVETKEPKLEQHSERDYY